MEVIHEAPSTQSFTPLSQHQSQTPESFYLANPVLYHHCPGAKLVILESELTHSRALSTLKALSPASANGTNTNGDAPSHDHEIVIPDIDIWVSSDKFILYAPSRKSGVSIPYPSISLHAIQRLRVPTHSTSEAADEESQGLFMQLTTSDGFDDHNPDDTISLTLIPSPHFASPSGASQRTGPEPAPAPTVSNPAEENTNPVEVDVPSEPPIRSLFSAVSACANLHPDPVSGSDADEPVLGDDSPSFDYQATHSSGDGLPPPMPGSGGWITAENMGEFFDEEGNWRGGGLGPGAGMVRGREEDADVMDGEVDNGDVEETKWRRTD